VENEKIMARGGGQKEMNRTKEKKAKQE